MVARAQLLLGSARVITRLDAQDAGLSILLEPTSKQKTLNNMHKDCKIEHEAASMPQSLLSGCHELSKYRYD